MGAQEPARHQSGGIIQPLNKDYSIDYEGTKAWINRQIEMGVDSITCDGACGEWMTFTVEERKKIYEVAVEAVAGRVPLLANTSHPSVMAAVELAKHAQDVGVDALMHVTPLLELVQATTACCATTSIMADQASTSPSASTTRSPSGYVLTPEFIKELAEKIPNVCGIKQGMGSIDQTLKAYQAGRPPDRRRRSVRGLLARAAEATCRRRR
jgi:4-hydroxy-tetrahydrodipicolinate synthase